MNLNVYTSLEVPIIDLGSIGSLPGSKPKDNNTSKRRFHQGLKSGEKSPVEGKVVEIPVFTGF